MEQGIILRGIGGIYDVQTEEGLLSCTLRGRLRLKDDRVLVGDRVEVSRDGNRGVVEHILPRQSELIRPAIANVDQVVVVFAVQNPPLNRLLLDRILVQAELVYLPAIIVFNKGDLDPKGADDLQELYGAIPYPVLITSAAQGEGLQELKEILKGKISTLAGPSGAGKSSLLNALDANLKLETGEVSAKLQRGKHTTRSVQLLPLDFQGYVADTPGFSQLNLGSQPESELQHAFPEFRPLFGECRFRECLHRREPNCAVKEAVLAGTIAAGRYEHYLLLLQETSVPRY